MTSITISPRPRVKHALLAAMALIVAGCMETGTGSAKIAVSQASPTSFINAFERYCAANIANPAKAVGLLQKDGYVPTTTIDKTLTVYSRSPSQPMVGIMTRDGSAKGCAILSRPDKSLQSAVATYMGRVSGIRPIKVADPRGNFDKSWVTDEPYKTFYVTFTSRDPKLGTTYTFTVGKAQN